MACTRAGGAPRIALRRGKPSEPLRAAFFSPRQNAFAARRHSSGNCSQRLFFRMKTQTAAPMVDTTNAAIAQHQQNTPSPPPPRGNSQSRLTPMNKMQKGFTLIELMIVVAIIAILAAIAIPQYQDYVTRSKWASNVTAVESYKVAFALCMQTNNQDPTLCDTPTKVLADQPVANQVVPVAPKATVTQTAATGAIVVTGTAELAPCVVTFTPLVVAGNLQNNGVTTGAGCSKSKTGY